MINTVPLRTSEKKSGDLTKLLNLRPVEKCMLIVFRCSTSPTTPKLIEHGTGQPNTLDLKRYVHINLHVQKGLDTLSHVVTGGL